MAATDTPADELYLLFRINADHYCVRATEISQVLQRQLLKQLPGAPDWVAGLLYVQEQVIPVIDIYQRMLHRPASRQSSTRLVLMQYQQHTLGLLLENVSSFVRLPAHGWQDSSVDLPHCRFLCAVQSYGQLGLVQRIALTALLPADVRAMLFAEAAGND